VGQGLLAFSLWPVERTCAQNKEPSAYGVAHNRQLPCHPALPDGVSVILSVKGKTCFWHAEMFNQLRGIAPQMLVARIGFSYTWTNCIAVEYPQNFYG
jgi:hypothetical protein